MSLEDFNKGRLFQGFIDDLECMDSDFANGITIDEGFLLVDGICCHFPANKVARVPGKAYALNLSSFTYDELSEIFRNILESVDA